MSAKNNNLTPLKDIISGMLKSEHLPFNAADGNIWLYWEESVGKAIASHARPLWIKNGILRVSVTDSVWLQELEFFKEDIIKKINEKLSRPAVKKIELRFGGQ